MNSSIDDIINLLSKNVKNEYNLTDEDKQLIEDQKNYLDNLEIEISHFYGKHEHNIDVNHNIDEYADKYIDNNNNVEDNNEKNNIVESNKEKNDIVGNNEEKINIADKLNNIINELNVKKQEYELPEELLNDDIIGIDLGTSNTCVAIWRNGCAEIIPDEYGNRTIPSFVAYSNRSRYIGNDAKNQKDLNTKNVFYEVKRLIGRKFTDPFVEREKEFLSYNIVSDSNDNILLKPEINSNKLYTPEEISASILSKAKQIASDYLEKEIKRCIITIPAHFNDGQRQATKDAATIAGLECIRIINEPTAAALAYGLLERTKTQKGNLKTVLVYDFGGGTLDVSLLNIENGIFEVLGASGNTKLGGSDFDKVLIDFCLKKFKYENKDFDIYQLSALSLQKLRTGCERAKHLLSTVTKTYIIVEDFYDGKSLKYGITRSKFEELCNGLFMLCMNPVHDILKQTNTCEDQIDEIILVGGMTKMPYIRELLKTKFKKEPNFSINPDEAVAAGAAIQGHLLSHKDDPFLATITLLDSTALSLGVETNGGIMDIVVNRGEMIPTNKHKIYSTDEDYVNSVIIKVYEGERTLTKDNFFVGEFELKGITPQPRGLLEIDVTFNIDINGIITVSAVNKKTNDRSSMSVISNKGRLSQEQIETLVGESKELEIKDILEKRKKMMHYEIKEMCANMTMNIKNKFVKLTDKDKNIINDDIDKIKLWLNEKRFEDRDDEEYITVLTSLKTKYALLIIKSNPDENVAAYAEQDKQVTTIYGNDDDEKEINKVFEEIENSEMGFDGMADPDKEELKALRVALNELCNSVLSILSSDDINILHDHKIELTEHIEDTLLWMHAHNKITKDEYIKEINETNRKCDVVFDYYKGQEDLFKKDDLIKMNTNKRNELENLCFLMKMMIEDGAFPVKDSCLNELKTIVNDTITWLYEQDENNNTNEDYDAKIELINNASNTVNNAMQGINVNEINDIFGGGRAPIIVDDDIKGGGTSIMDLIQRNVALATERLIINDEDED